MEGTSRLDRVTLGVYVDARLALRETMAAVDRLPSHGCPGEFPLRLTPGPHTIRVVAEGRVACASIEIVVGGRQLHVDAAYEGSPGGRGEPRNPERISFHVGAERPGFR